MQLDKGWEFIKDKLDDAVRIKRKLKSQLGNIPYLPQTTFVYREEYAAQALHLADFDRSRKIIQYLLYEACIIPKQIIAPKTATITQLNMVHDFAYLSRLNESEVSERIFGQTVSSSSMRMLVEQQRMMTGGTIRAARIATAPIYPKRIINLGGGFHHAYSDAGYGFCVFNDVAIAIAHLRKHGFNKPILIIDLDLHQGDGTKSIFANDPQVTCYSVHAETWETGEYTNHYDVALGPGIGDAAYLHAIKSTLPSVIHKVQPKLVFYLAGVDVAEDDELGDWSISHDAIFERDCFVDQAVGKRRMVIVTAGGYGRNAWRHSARFFAYLSAGLDKPIPSNNQRLLENIRKLSRGIPLVDLTAEEDEDDFAFFAQAQRKTKLFDFYSQYGVECALESFGVLPYLRKIGFIHCVLEMDLEHPNGQCLRLFSGEQKKDLLIEIVMDEKKDDSGYKLLWIEWLLLQNPTVTTTSSKPLLPGQTHPGLGCLHKVLGMIFMLCDRLHFDAIGFNPAYYHICLIAKGEAFFENPQSEAHFRIAQNLVAGMELSEASRALHHGVDVGAGMEPYKWQPARMIIPLTETLRQYYHAQKYQREVERYVALQQKRMGKRVPKRFKVRAQYVQND